MNYYDVLGIPVLATSDDIKVAFRKLAHRWHPDKNMGRKKEEQAHAEEKYREVREAFEVLSNPAKRATYDAQFNIGYASTSPLVGKVVPADLLADLEKYFSKHLAVSPGVTLLLSLWTMHSFVF